MVRLAKWLIVLAALAAVVAFFPIGGRTVLERWRAARGPAAFLEKGWAELKAGAVGLLGRPTATRHGDPPRTARPAHPAPRGHHPAEPVERHSEADRDALDEIVAKHVK